VAIHKIKQFFFDFFVAGLGTRKTETLLSAISLNSFKSSVDDQSNFITFHKRPKAAIKVDSAALSFDCPQTGIVVQGGIDESSDFTFETLKLYKSNYPKAQIVLSTWNTLGNEAKIEFEKLGVHLVLSEIPENPGPGNSNLQLISTKAGLLKAQELNVQYVVKTRTDQRFYSKTALSFLISMIRSFPLSAGIKNQKMRLAFLSVDTFILRPYGPSDFLTFGTIEDVLNYWDSPADLRNPSEASVISDRTCLALAKDRMCEVYFGANFLEKIGESLLWSVEDWCQSLRNRFIVIDPTSLDFFWPKYTGLEFRWKSYSKSPLAEFTFAEWLSLYEGSDVSNYEDLQLALETPFVDF
jgi:hypothetical protein